MNRLQPQQLTTSAAVDFFVQGEVESALSDYTGPLEYRPSDVTGFEDAEQLWDAFVQDVMLALKLFFKRYSLVLPQGYNVLFTGPYGVNGPVVDVLLTLQGAGAGIWDGRWDEYVQEQNRKFWIDRLVQYLKDRLDIWSDGTGGGVLEEAFRIAAENWIRDELPDDVYKKVVLREKEEA